MRAQATLARQAGLYVMHHDDGAIRPILPDLIEIFSRCKGYILGPCHNIQPITPTANILALYEAAHAYGPSPRIS